MKIIEPSVILIKEDSPLKLIERVGRVCYKSENLIREGSSEKFTANLIKSKHYAVLEHSSIFVTMTQNRFEVFRDLEDETGKLLYNFKYFNITSDNLNGVVISGSFRAWRDLFLKSHTDFLHLLCRLYWKYPVVFEDVISLVYQGEELPSNTDLDKFEYIEIVSEEDIKTLYITNPNYLMEHITHSLLFVCDRGISHELVRHRNCAFAQESTRYCNYSLDKFGKEISVIKPYYFDDIKGENTNQYECWSKSCEAAENAYFNLLDIGVTSQEARCVLPNSLKTEIVVTANEWEWQNILDLRYYGTTGAPHPQMREVMSMARDILIRESEGRVQ